MVASHERDADARGDALMVETQSRAVRSASGNRTDAGSGARTCTRGGSVKFALVNPNWDFKGSTYFGCQDPHYPLELLFSYDKIREAGHDPLLVDAQVENLSIEEARRRIKAFEPDFLVIPTAPSYLFWRCPPPEVRVPRKWFSALGEKSVRVAVGPHSS